MLRQDLILVFLTVTRLETLQGSHPSIYILFYIIFLITCVWRLLVSFSAWKDCGVIKALGLWQSPAYTSNQAVTANFAARPHPALSYISQHCAIVYICVPQERSYASFFVVRQENYKKQKQEINLGGKMCKIYFDQEVKCNCLGLLYLATNQSAVSTVNGHHSLTVTDKG